MITKLFDQLIYLILLCQPVDFYLKIYIILLFQIVDFLKKNYVILTLTVKMKLGQMYTAKSTIQSFSTFPR